MSTRVPVGTYGRRARLAARFSTLFRSRCTAVPVLVYRIYLHAGTEQTSRYTPVPVCYKVHTAVPVYTLYHGTVFGAVK